MIKKLTIPVDHGNRNMKTTHFLFTTGLSSTDRKPAGREDFLQTDGKFYVLSDKRIPYQRDKTQDERFHPDEVCYCKGTGAYRSGNGRRCGAGIAADWRAAQALR